MLNVIIGVIVAIAILVIAFLVVRYRKNQEEKSHEMKPAYVPSHLKSQEPPQDESALDSAMNIVNSKESPVVETPTTEEDVPPMNIQDIIDATRAASQVKPADITMLDDVIVEDNPALRRIRSTKIKLLIKVLKEKMIKVSPKIYTDLLTYDPNGFTFCRWKIEEKDGLYTDTNRLERYTLLDMIRQRINFASIDFIVYGKESIMADDKGTVNIDPAWWNFTHCFLIHPASFNISAVMDAVFSGAACAPGKEFSFLISSDCLMTVLDDLVNTVTNTNVFQSTLEYRASELKNAQEKSAARVLNDRFQDFLHPERLADKHQEADPNKGVIQEVISVESTDPEVTIEGDLHHA